jgi:hypothetical protein
MLEPETAEDDYHSAQEACVTTPACRLLVYLQCLSSEFASAVVSCVVGIPCR